jgi:hypothetical protein
MQTRIHRTPAQKAKRVADMLRNQQQLETFLRQFSPAHHAGLMLRLESHLSFRPKPLR